MLETKCSDPNGGDSATSTKPNDDTNKTKIQLSAMRPHYYKTRTKTQTNKRLHSMHTKHNKRNTEKRKAEKKIRKHGK